MNILWCGDDQSAKAYAESLYKMPEAPKGVSAKLVVPGAEASAFKSKDYGWFEVPPMAYVSGSTAVIQIRGSLIPGRAGVRQLMGMVGYEDIKAALIEAVSMAEVDGILLEVDSPGGAVSGLNSALSAIKNVGKLKPVVTYAMNACSAAYWLASGTPFIAADEMGQVGSIGTLIQVTNRVDALAKEGYKIEVFKSGSLKMAGNPNEEMSDEVRKYFEEQISDMAAIFYKAVGDSRKLSVEEVKVKFGDGRSMLGVRGLSTGLLDAVGSVNVAHEHLRKLASRNRAKIGGL